MTSPAAAREPILRLRGVSKAFPGVQALTDVALDLYAGEVLALVGENGAGKSTLMKILAGVYIPDAGTITLDGRVVRFANVSDALHVGISLMHQELNLAENLSVAANLFLGREPLRVGPIGWLDHTAIRTQSCELMRRVGLDPALVDTLVGELPPGQRQLVEIARALSLSARILIMDEPTSSLTQKEADRLVEVIEQLKAQGVAIVYISHRLGEVRRISDRAVVLRDGCNAGELAREQISHESLVRLMVGRDLKSYYPRSARNPQSGGFSLENITYRGGPTTGVSLTIRPGEIVGMAGLIGAGRTELAEAIFGLRSIVSGHVCWNGARLALGTPQAAIEAGILLVPEDRRLHGLVLEESIRFNLSLPNLRRIGSSFLIPRGQERALAQQQCDRLRVKTSSIEKAVGLLSGGNQQKVVIGKWLARAPKLLILDEPTRGVDVGAKSEIYAVMAELAQSGVAIWMISSDLEEILGMSDRVLVLHEGQMTGELSRDALSEEAVMNLATGGGVR